MSNMSPRIYYYVGPFSLPNLKDTVLLDKAIYGRAQHQGALNTHSFKVNVKPHNLHLEIQQKPEHRIWNLVSDVLSWSQVSQDIELFER